jgi:RNA polymerase sigma-70 factor (ECF subfamily)
MTGDPDTFRELLAAHADRVFSYACYLLQQREEAEDVTQEAFLRLWRRGALEDGSQTEAWLLRVVHNLCIDIHRRRRTRRRHVLRLEAHEVNNLPAPEDVTDPDLQLRLDERQRAVLAAVERLDPASRSAILMHYYLGLPLREVALALGTSEGAIKVRIHRARRNLRRLFATEDQHRPDPRPACRTAAAGRGSRRARSAEEYGL